MKHKLPHPIKLPSRILVLWIKPPLFLGKLENTLLTFVPTHSAPQALVISLRSMPFIVKNELRILEKIVEKLRAQDVAVLLTEANNQVKARLEQSKLLETIGGNCYYDDFDGTVTHCYKLNVGGSDQRLMVIDAFAESMLITSCNYFHGDSAT